MTTPLLLLVCITIGVIAVCGSGSNIETEHVKNVLFIVVDDLRPNLGVYGDVNAYTPHIDAFARESCVFNNAYVQQALCGPSRTSFLTSRRPHHLNLYDVHSYWRVSAGNFTTMPQFFKDHGFVTYSIGKVFHPGRTSNSNDDYPLSWTWKAFHPSTQKYKDADVCPPNVGDNLLCPIDVNRQPDGTLPDMESLHEAKRFLSKHHQDKYFLAVGFHKPHIPLKFPRDFLAQHDVDAINLPKARSKPSLMPTLAWNPWNDLRKRDDVARLNLSYPFEQFPELFARQIIQHYNAAVSYVDELIGDLLAVVDLSKTVVVLVGDHGVSMGEHGEYSKFSNFDVATRVPLIIHAPHLTTNRLKRIETIVELVDLFPTIADLAGIDINIPHCNGANRQLNLCTDGRTLTPLMTNNDGDQDDGVAFMQYPRPGVFPSRHPDSDQPKLHEITIMGYSMRTNAFRYTEWVRFANLTPQWDAVHARELYAHQIDPHEDMNLAARPEMRRIMYDLRKQLMRKFGG